MSLSNWATCEACDHPHPMFVPKGAPRESISSDGEVKITKNTYNRLMCIPCLIQLRYTSYQDRMDEINTLTESEFFIQ